MGETNIRKVERVIDAQRLTEGAGLPVRRTIGARIDADPFLLLDHFGPVTWGPEEASGVPDHPHRGFETVTYLLEGAMEHRDSTGGGAVLNPGDVQWMTAGAGIVHSEMPEAGFLKKGGTLHGFQLWVNLPARDKMTPPRYQDLSADAIPRGASADGRAGVRVVAGEALGVKAAIDTHTPILYQHWTLRPGADVTQPVLAGHNAVAYVFSGRAALGADGTEVAEGQLAVFGAGDAVRLAVPDGGKEAAELILLSGAPLNEPVARYGPFVMNTYDEIRRAIRDYEAGRMGRIAPAGGTS